MALVIHIIIASLSLVFSTLSIFSPSNIKIKINYLFIAGTLASGTLLVFQKHVDFGHMCLSGLTYLTITSVNIFLAKRKLSRIYSDL